MVSIYFDEDTEPWTSICTGIIIYGPAAFVRPSPELASSAFRDGSRKIIFVLLFYFCIIIESESR